MATGSASRFLDTGIGIPGEDLQAIFEEYHQLDNAARERSRGLGLGLSIVQRLGSLLGHRIRVHSDQDKGSVFAIEVKLVPGAVPPRRGLARPVMALAAPVGTDRSGTILVVEDVPELRELLARLLGDAGHRVVVAPDGLEAVELVTRGVIHPELILADYNLPNGLNGLQLVARLRKTLNQEIPVIILTGDISTDTLRAIARQGCVQLNKPVKLAEMLQTIQRLLALPQAAATPHPGDAAEAVSLAAIHPATIHIVDDDRDVRRAMRAVLEQAGRTVEDYASCEAFLDRYRPGGAACLVVDAYLPGMPGLELLRWLGEAGHALPSIMMTGSSDVPMAVEAMKAGASDFIEKPVLRRELLASIDRALEQSRDSGKLSAWHAAAAGQVASLTPRQREIMDRVLAGEPSKNIAADLGISQRTVENHRASIMKRTGVKSLPALARLALAAADGGARAG